MGFNLPIPPELSHLKLDKRGYPVPYFVSWVNGEPEFRFIDRARQLMIIDRKVCHICGKKLPDDYFYFISGPIGLMNRVSSDAAMHRLCAEFSLRACPHLYLEKAARRDNDELGKKVAAQADPIHIPDKPKELYLIKASKFKKILVNRDHILRYNVVSADKYIYIDNKLTKEQ